MPSSPIMPSLQPTGWNEAIGFFAPLSDVLFRIRWFGAAALVGMMRALRLRPEDLDTLFPWVLLSMVVNVLVWLALLVGLAGTLPKKTPVSSLVEISLTPNPLRPQMTSPAVPTLRRPDGMLPVRRESVPSTASPAARAVALNAYLKDWESRIMAQAQKRLFAGGHPVLPQGRVVVAVTIAPDGQLMQIEMRQGSKNIALVNAVDTIIREAAPFPALPAIWQSPPTPLRIVRTWGFE
ncbi:TonB C-terminal domain-containing protein [Acidithiobacillus sp.]|uniref:TonB C-terminal domain-containing protein n=1 Tax=Acidithiobacillus sp. TaxID=1872118 RepID=UPI0025C36DEC|nr:TonB C-terminal domain-containing protein [Acidithiobacillus sp.]MCK9188001.1 TonB C-terminal domain-containing protein [Acidithiobacillus sp.]MCK9359961.1 TonB C-terminal domain-containing protein [Acidithiobacillus sp.]